MNELKYPIKYAIMQIKNQNGWTSGGNELESTFGVVANIISKCYVISERKEYLQDGTTKKIYEVVFVYQDQNIVYPEYSIYGSCINSEMVDRVYDNINEALLAKDKANKKIINNNIGILPYNEKFKETVKDLKEKHQNNLDRYNILEQEIERKTQSLSVEKENSSNITSIIEKIVEMPSDFYCALATHLSKKEIKYLKTLIEDKSCTNCTNNNCQDTNKNTRKNICDQWDNQELIGKQKILMR